MSVLVMDFSFRTLKAAVDGAQKAHDSLTDMDLSSRIETAGRKTGEQLAEERDDLGPEGVRERLAIALEDEELAERVAELIERGEPVASESDVLATESELLATELERLADEGAFADASTIPEVDWSQVAELFLETFEREVMAMDDGETKSRLLLAYSQQILAELTPEEFTEVDEYIQRSLNDQRGIEDRESQHTDTADDSAEAKRLAVLGTVAFDRGDFETAKNRYESALPTVEEHGDVRAAIRTYSNLARTEEELGNVTDAIEWCERGLSSIDEHGLSGVEDDWRALQTRRVRLEADPEETENLYSTALGRILNNDLDAAFDLLEGVWDCRESFDSGTETFEICLQAGVGYAAPSATTDTDDAAEVVESVSEEIEPHRDSLSEPATVLFEFITDGDTDTDPDELREPANTTDPELDDLERIAYALLLEILTEDVDPTELYTHALTNTDDPNTAIQSFHGAWDKRDTEVEPHASNALAAGVFLEAYRDAFDADLPTDRETVFEAVRNRDTTLPDAITALFERLDTGATDTTPAELRNVSDHEDPDLDDVERLVAAQFLERLQN
jgi:tetratricopeptide (TPR) repeat protein